MQTPPCTQTPTHTERNVGFEIEYAGLPLEQAATIIHRLFGGTITTHTSALCEVTGTRLGDFTVELDARPLQKLAQDTKRLEQDLANNDNLIDAISLYVGRAVGETGAKIAPFEIVAPPVPLSKLDALEELVTGLREAGAKDTTDTFYYAFGLHINPEVSSFEADDIRRHLQSFLLLEPWLKAAHNVDLTRRVTSFIDPFPKDYLQQVLDADYQPNLDQLIRDYHTHNPTRNRSLDMLPLFAHLNEPLVRELYGDEEKINARPTFHYRLPNCELGNPDWSLDTEWQRWLKVETLAQDDAMLSRLLTTWQIFNKRWRWFESKWLKELNKILKAG